MQISLHVTAEILQNRHIPLGFEIQWLASTAHTSAKSHKSRREEVINQILLRTIEAWKTEAHNKEQPQKIHALETEPEMNVPYSGKLSRDKTFANRLKRQILRRKLSRIVQKKFKGRENSRGLVRQPLWTWPYIISKHVCGRDGNLRTGNCRARLPCL